MPRWIPLLLIFAAPQVLCASSNAVHAVQGLIERVLPREYRDKFELEEIPLGGAEHGVFEIDADRRASKVILRGSSGVELASALNWYLKDYASGMVSWTGDQLVLPEPLPLPSEKRRTERVMKYSYYQNTCTASYSFSFYDWAKWEREIDWMALNGINFPLAFNGQEHIFTRTYERFGVSFEDLQEFFAGPAFQTWQRMGNIYSWGGPVSRAFVEDQRQLQLRILERMRSFGMTPILTAFSGVVPNKLRALHPKIQFTKSGWGGDWGATWLLDPRDPLFTDIGSTFIEIQMEEYGTDHFYNTDTFNENNPPSRDPEYLRTSAKAVYDSMRQADEQSVWVMQGWMFYHQSNFWQPPQVQGLLSGVPDDKMIILDLFAESFPVWDRIQSFFGKPFIWCHLHNYGGSIGMYGRLQIIGNDPVSSFQDEKSSMVGVGLTMEGIRQNYILYDLVLEQAYRNSPTNVPVWVSGANPSEPSHDSWVARRYGAKMLSHAPTAKSLGRAWHALQTTILSTREIIFLYQSPVSRHPLLDLSRVDQIRRDEWARHVGRPLESMPAHQIPDLVAAWEHFIDVAKQGDGNPLKASETYRYDLVDVTRQVLSELFKHTRKRFSHAYIVRDIPKLEEYAATMLKLIDDMEVLLSTEAQFLLGVWIQDARRLAPPGEEDHFEFNARNQVTLWGPSLSLNDYATKEWSGLMGEYFYHRYSDFVDGVIKAAETRRPFDQEAFNEEMNAWGLEWDQQTDPHGRQFPEEPFGDSIEVSILMHERYQPMAATFAEEFASRL